MFEKTPNQRELDEFKDYMFTNAIEKYKSTKEYEYHKLRDDHIDEQITTMLRPDERTFVEEVLYELGCESERKMRFAYDQAWDDCVWLLKRLGVLA